VYHCKEKTRRARKIFRKQKQALSNTLFVGIRLIDNFALNIIKHKKSLLKYGSIDISI